MKTATHTDHKVTISPGSPSKRPTWGLRVAVNLFLGLGSTVVALGVAEVAVRLAPRHWVPELGSYQAQEFNLREVCRPSENPRLYFELIPKNPASEVNEAGYRGPLYPEKKASGVQRVVGLGDSSFYGLNVSEADGCLRQLELLLRADRCGSVEVVNLAVPGYNSRQELELLRTRGLRFEPDLIVLGYDHNDPQPLVGHNKNANLLPDDYGRNPLGSELLRYVWRKLYLMRLTHAERDPGGNVCFEGNPIEGPLWDRHREALAEIGRLAKDRGIPVVVVIYDAWITRDDDRTSEHYRRLHERLLPLLREHRFYVVDCYDLFQDYMREHRRQDTKSLWVSIRYRDGHPNAKAHRIIAEAIHQTIRQHNLLP